tara:strand:+ start:1910 stop:2734 length:825 start_codon:yes stop_codon:yes gene_type:complete
MAWAKFIGSAIKDSNQLTLLSAVPASQIPKGYEVLVGDIGNLEVSYGTSVMYDSEGKPFSHLYLVRAYAGETSNDVEVIIKPTGSNLNEAVDIFRSGSNQLNQLTALYRQFVEGESPVIYQPFDESQDPIEIKPLLLIQQESNQILGDVTAQANTAISAAEQEINTRLGEAIDQANASVANSEQLINDSLAASEQRTNTVIVNAEQAVNDSIAAGQQTITTFIDSSRQEILELSPSLRNGAYASMVAIMKTQKMLVQQSHTNMKLDERLRNLES